MKYIKLLLGLILIALAVPGSITASGQGGGKKVQAVYEGELKKPVHISNFSGDDYFSARDVAQAYGSSLIYHPVTGKVALLMNNRRLDIYIKSTRVYIDGQKKRLSIPTRLVAGELYVPASFILSGDFAKFTGTVSQYNPSPGILTIDRKTNLSPPRFYSNPGSTQIIIELGEVFPYEWNEKQPGFLSVTFQGGHVSEGKTEVADGVVKGIETKNIGRQARVTVTLDSSAGKAEKIYYEASKKLVITIPKAGSEKLLLQAAAQGATAVSSGTFAETGVSSAAAGGYELSPATDTAALGLLPALAAVTPAVSASSQKKKLIILDAGHGGDDPGAIGPNGTKEKDINLAIVFELKRLFEEDGEYNVLLTRMDDTFIPLVERTSFANDHKADMFIAVHCNANMDKNVNGFEIYFLSEHASDSDAAATAVLENSVVRLEGKPNKKRAKLQELLWSMTVNEFINESAELCSMIGSEVPRRTKIENRGVKQAEFFVLRGAIMPAVLVECAFLSNYGEEAKLRTKRLQAGMADSIFEGVKKYDRKRESLNAKNQQNETF